MSIQPGGLEEALERGPDELAPLPDGLEIFARLEGLVEQERALLAISESERTVTQRSLLRAIGSELDRVSEKLRRREPRETH